MLLLAIFKCQRQSNHSRGRTVGRSHDCSSELLTKPAGAHREGKRHPRGLVHELWRGILDQRIYFAISISHWLIHICCSNLRGYYNVVEHSSNALGYSTAMLTVN